MSPAAWPTPDAHLWVLEDESVFFSEGRQELLTFNTAATFLWCCLEEGLDVDRIFRAYAEAFSVAPAKARPVVARVLRRWRGLGYLGGLELEPDEETAPELEDVLAWLLTNEELRGDFAADPAGTGGGLGLLPAVVEALAAVPADQIEAQAAAVVDEMRTLRAGGDGHAGASPVTPSALSATLVARGHHVGREPIAHTYRLLDTRILVRVPTPELGALLHPLFAHVEDSDPAAPDVVLDVLEHEGGYVLAEDALPVLQCVRDDEIAPLLKATVRRVVADRHRPLLEIHAGVVEVDGSLIMIPAAPGTGKTTLVATLLHSGFGFFSDEFAMLEREDLRVRPVPLPMTIKPGSLELLTSRYPDIGDAPAHRREDDQFVRYVAPPQATPDPDIAHPVRWVVFPTREDGAGTELCPLTRPEGLRRLMRECLILPDRLERGSVEQLVQWLRNVDFYELGVVPLESAVTTLQELTGARSPS